MILAFEVVGDGLHPLGGDFAIRETRGKRSDEAAAVTSGNFFDRLAEEGIETAIRGDDGTLGINDGDTFITGGGEPLKGGEGLAQEPLGIQQALGSLRGMLLGGIEGLALLREDHVDIAAELPEVTRQPFGGLCVRRDTAEHGGGAFHDSAGRFQHPAAKEVGSKEDTAAEDDAGDAVKPVQGLVHQLGRAHGRQEAE